MELITVTCRLRTESSPHTRIHTTAHNKHTRGSCTSEADESRQSERRTQDRSASDRSDLSDPVTSSEALKRTIQDTMDKMDRAVVRDTCGRFRSWLERMVAAEGGHIE